MRNNEIASSAKIASSVVLGEGVYIGKDVEIKSGCIIEDNVQIKDNTVIDYNVIIRSDVIIGEDSFVGAGCILGEFLLDDIESTCTKSHPLILGKNALIRSNSIIYGDSEIGDFFQTGHRVTIREKSKIGNHVNIGTLSDIQGDCIIGDYVRMHSNVHIGQKSLIEDFVWIFPYVVLTNDPTPPSNELKGVVLKSFAVVSTGSIILPGIEVAGDSLVAAGAVVTKNVNSGEVVGGNPAKVISNTSRIKNHITGEEVYPWRYSFKRGMPWEETDYDTWIKNRNSEK